MNYSRALTLFFRAASTGNADAMVQAMPDARLVHPVGNYGFPARDLDNTHCFAASWPLACSGVRPPLNFIPVEAMTPFAAMVGEVAP